MSARAFIAIIDDVSCRGVHLSNDGERAFDMLTACYQDRYRAEALVAFGDMLGLAPEPAGCHFYSFREGMPTLGKTIDQLLSKLRHPHEDVFIYDARKEVSEFAPINVEAGNYTAGRREGCWTEMRHDQRMQISPALTQAA